MFMFHRRKPKKTFFIFKYKLILLTILLCLCFLSIIPIEFGFNDSDIENKSITSTSSMSKSLNQNISYSFLSNSQYLINNSEIYNYKLPLNNYLTYNYEINKNYIELTIDELTSYSSLNYDERITFLNNNDYSLEDRIKVFLGDDIENFSLVYYNLLTNEIVNINESKEFLAASTYKIGLNLLVYNLASTGEIDLTDTITYESSDYEDGTGLLCTEPTIGTYTIQELLDLSIQYSDNIATNMLGRYLGGHALVRKNLYELLNIDYPYEENTITADIESQILMYIYNHRDSENYSHLIDTLTKTEFHERLDKYIPQDIVAHKIGSNESYIHDVGIILSDSPYILAIYTNNLTDAEEKIAQISKAIYYNYN